MRSLTKMAAVIALVLALSMDRSASAQKGAGGGAGANNIVASLDADSGILTVTGDSAPNLFVVEAWDSTVFISPGPWNLTKVNGQTGGQLFDVFSAQLTIVINTAGGNDRVWITTGQTDMPLELNVNGADGADEIQIQRSLQSPDLNGDLRLEAGRGDDIIKLVGVAVLGHLTIQGGDNNDSVSIIDSTWNGGSAPTVAGLSLLDGGRGRDELAAPAFFLTESVVTNFEKTVPQ